MSHIRSKKRVEDLGEVFTDEREVKAMLELVGLSKGGFYKDITKIRKGVRIFEPAVGTGNFLIGALRHMHSVIEYANSDALAHTKKIYISSSLRNYLTDLLWVVCSLYGVDIMEDNVLSCRNNLLTELDSSIRKFLESRRIFKVKGCLQTYDKDLREPFLRVARGILLNNIIIGDTINAPHKIHIVEYYPGGSESLPNRKYIQVKICTLQNMVDFNTGAIQSTKYWYATRKPRLIFSEEGKKVEELLLTLADKKEVANGSIEQ